MFVRRERNEVLPNHVLLRVCQWGPSDGPAVVLVHGILDQAIVWEPVAEALAEAGYHVIAPDLRGHGLSHASPAVEGYGLLSFVADLSCLVESLELDSFVLAGHSLGSLVALLYTNFYPARVLGLVPIENLVLAGCDKLDMQSALQKDVECLRRTHQHTVLPDLDAAIKLLRAARPGVDAGLARRLCERGTRQEGCGLVWRWDPILRTRLGLRFPGRQGQYLDMLRQIRVPVSLVFGKHSAFTREEDANLLLAAMPHARITHAAGTHDVHLEDPRAIVRAVMSIKPAHTSHPSRVGP